MKRPSAILFDFFGTLVNYVERAEHSSPDRTLQTLSALGVSTDLAELRTRMDNVYDPLEAAANQSGEEYHTHTAMRHLLQTYGVKPTADAVESVARDWITDWSRSVSMVDGLNRALAALETPMHIVSTTSTPWLVGDAIGELGIGDHFLSTTASVDVGWRKPRPEIYELAIERSGFPASELLFVGDNPDCDYHGPVAAGMQAVWISTVPSPAIPEESRITVMTDLPQWLSQRSRGR
jgi:putative hydrolase of the HAD superfamily